MTSSINLSAENIVKDFGRNRVLTGVSFSIEGPQLVGLIGPNGAGKTTLTNILSGIHAPSSGTIHLDGIRIDGLSPSKVAKTGLGRTFQVTRALRRMTIMENMMVPALAMHPTTPARNWKPKHAICWPSSRWGIWPKIWGAP